MTTLLKHYDHADTMNDNTVETLWEHYDTIYEKTMETLWKHYENTMRTLWEHLESGHNESGASQPKDDPRPEECPDRVWVSDEAVRLHSDRLVVPEQYSTVQYSIVQYSIVYYLKLARRSRAPE